MTLNTCTPILGAHVFSFEREDQLLTAFKDFIIAADPDILTGYNIMNFDIPYLYNRARSLGLTEAHKIGRIRDKPMTVRKSNFHSNQHGNRETHDISIDGRVMIDMLTVMQNEHRMSSYSLNSVSQHFLGSQKEDVHWSIISDLQEKDAESRQRLAVYCLKDALLPLLLMDKLKVVVNFTELSRVTSVPMSYLSIRGQQIRVISLLYRYANKKHMIVPCLKNQITEEKYQGATVIEPQRGFYPDPVVTLDFSSLYPSIMICHNLCYSTLLHPEAASKLDKDDYNRTPTGNFFIKSHLHKGLLPEILEWLLAARKRTRKELAEATDPMNKLVLNGRQLAFKVTANTVYGFTGAQVGRLPCLEISRSVTAYGRQMIDRTKSIVEDRYTTANGYGTNAVVIYGDTDSVMINFGIKDLPTAMARGKEAADLVTSVFNSPPIKLEFEKVYWPYLLISKKRYAGLFWTKTDKFDKIDTKGIETVRRDNCAMVRLVYETCLQKILVERDIEGAQSFTKQIISDLLQNKIDLSLLLISKQLTRSAEQYENKQPHVELAKRMKERDGSGPGIGDRVFYVIVEGPKNAKAYEKSEDPQFVMDRGLSIDTDYYLNQQLAKPLERLFKPIMGDGFKSLLNGEHTRVIRKPSKVTAQATGMLQFVGVVRTCINCKARMGKDEQGAVCTKCKPKEPELFMDAQRSASRAEEQYSQVHAQCQRCSMSMHQPFLCSSRDCPLFYFRTKAKKDLEDCYELLKRFGSPCVFPDESSSP
ncbi:putative DNA polymerase delta catalytic subunit [Blattamonas nauphoetae]|uniref:DNA polymerase n=1 Tax=Blattamonas nauphoetae TaxID=2049346 RepID=A0ABQ9YG22_9EUKA|nr:putative DNA polymerase delta catalytic subunit [Blattamonas nauphoetae]